MQYWVRLFDSKAGGTEGFVANLIGARNVCFFFTRWASRQNKLDTVIQRRWKAEEGAREWKNWEVSFNWVAIHHAAGLKY